MYIGEEGKVTLKLKDQLSYTNAVVHETMRYNTVVPVGVPHKTTCDTSLGKKLQHQQIDDLCIKSTFTQFLTIRIYYSCEV